MKNEKSGKNSIDGNKIRSTSINKKKIFSGASSSKAGSYRCPNCDEGKPTERGKCPICGARGAHQHNY